jgi:hypothetical protein
MVRFEAFEAELDSEGHNSVSFSSARQTANDFNQAKSGATAGEERRRHRRWSLEAFLNKRVLEKEHT